MKILSIETSCDETGISIIEVKGTKNPSFRVLANVLNSQIKIHAPFGGVYPSLAKREHIKNLPILLERAFKKTTAKTGQAKLKEKDIDLISVTFGPGLEPALWTGIVFAKELAQKWKIPIIPVNHMEGHILSVFGKNKNTFKINKIEFPALSLLVSGGHTELVLMKDWGNYKIIGETLDDASGEAFDKVARMLQLPYPGGPEISKLAEKARKEKIISEIKLPRPMIYSKDFNFSFSGLKTAVLYLIRDLKEKDSNILQNDKMKQMIAKEFEDAVIETLVYKTKKATEKYKVNTLIVAGGVSANKYLKKEIIRLRKDFGKTRKNLKIYFPDNKLSGDNALMIGIAGYFNFIKNKKKPIKASKIRAEGGLRL